MDCGTNSLRLLVADIEGNSFREVQREMRVVRLGEGIDRTKNFSEAALTRTFAGIDEFASFLRRKGVESLRFCATSASRDAQNRALFVEGVRERLGIEPEIIPGTEEAALSFAGATREFSSGPFLVVDIGGGSTEFVYGNDEVEFARSVNIGCVRMTERHQLSEYPSPESIALAIADIDAAIAEAAAEVPLTSGATLIAVAGTATTVAAAGLDLNMYDRDAIHLSRVSAESVTRISQMFLKMSKAERAELPYMHEGRVDVISSGALVLDRVMLATGAKEFVASEHDILDGIAWSQVSK
ncbi:MAG: exopolyphosphatase [Actinobacteria bacterium]|nr:exopolyphosphatase [Actinomycetota bacterium]MSY26495.1 exopolyphosphatase [Actinomycetota bacterium]MSZ87155.1 exopolyphosphatase [Actinomycetota bacterium]MTB14198.1 exopolyphosphatase [Actinomycetota bacterium]MTB24398.1 exopolyphosphatase [Actinomycetota bacterium]